MRRGANIVAVFSGVWLLISDPGHAQDLQATEYQVKAVLLFNFAKLVDWPSSAFPDAASPIVIGVLGDNPFHDDLTRTVQGKTINNRPVVIKEFSSVAEARNCHILFISLSEKKRLAEILQAMRGLSV